MTADPTTAEGRLAQLGIQLPAAPTPLGAYVPAVQTGNLLFLSGMLATAGGTPTAVGVVGHDLDVAAGRAARARPRSTRSPSSGRSWARSTARPASSGSACTSSR